MKASTRFFKPTGERLFLTFLLFFLLFPIAFNFFLAIELHKLIYTVVEAGTIMQKQEDLCNMLFLFFLLLSYVISCFVIFLPTEQN